VTSRRGFTLIELLVVVGIITALVLLIMPALNKAIITVQRNSCMANLRRVAEACIAYAKSGQYHRGQVDGTLPSLNVGDSTWGDITTPVNDTDKGNAECLWLLVRHNFASRSVFMCPEAVATLGWEEPAEDATSFTYDPATNISTLAYSYISMVNEPESDNEEYWDRRVDTRLGGDMQSALVILADKNPRMAYDPDEPDFYSPQGKEFGHETLADISSLQMSPNSFNHRSEGQNIARLDMSAAWTDETNAGNTNSNDIYAADDSDDDGKGLRSTIDDAFCLP